MTEVTRAWRWPPRRRPNGSWDAERRALRGSRGAASCGLRTSRSWGSDPFYLKYTEMKRKIVSAGKLRLSPNEEACILKEDYERRRKLRLLQVREQERDIALQIREDIKQRRNQQFTRLADKLRAEWENSHTQKIQKLEKLYLGSLRNMGEGHRQAKENEPDLDALALRAAERKRKAEVRHKEALKVQKNQKEILMKQKTWHIQTRKEALLVEKERSAKITSLPLPLPAPFENIEVKRISSVKTNSSTYHHISTFVNRQMDTKQPDAHLAAEEEAKRLEELQKQAARERMEQFEKAHERGFQAMKKIHLAHNQEKLMKELKQLQQEDLARKRQTVAQMPPQLVELPYKRSEIKDDWQRELEFAFEDVYNADRKVKGNLILHLEPEPLPTVTDQIQDEDLDLSMEQENKVLHNANFGLLIFMSDSGILNFSTQLSYPLAMNTQHITSKILFKKLLNKIRSQKSLWTIKSMSADEGEMTTVSETGSKAAGAVGSKERTLSSEQQVVESDTLTIESGPLSSEDKPLSCQTEFGKEQEVNETPPGMTVAQSSVLLHPQEEAVRVRTSARQKQVGTALASCTVISDEDGHRQMIRNYQQQLLQQNRLHKQSVETARKRLLEYQTILKGRYPSMSATSLISDSVISILPQKSEKRTAISEHWNQSQRLKLSLNMQPIQICKLEQDHIQVPGQNHFPQRQIKTTEIVRTSDVLANIESQEYLRQFSKTETQQRDYKLVPKDSHKLSGALSYDQPQVLQGAREIPETLRVPTFQALESQQILSDDSENISSKLTEPSSFLPLASEHSFTFLPVKVESGKIQEPLSIINKSTVSIGHSAISQIHDHPLTSSETIAAQQGHLKALQEQLELQKSILQARQEQLLLYKQKELEEHTGLSALHPVVTVDSHASLSSAKAEPGRFQDSSPANRASVLPSGNPALAQWEDRLLHFSQPMVLQQSNLKFLQEHLNIQRDVLQARREAQEVLLVHKQNELDGRICSEQAEPSFLPQQVTQHMFTSLPFANTKSREKGLFSSQSEISGSQDGSSSFLQQFPPLSDNFKLFQEQQTTQRDMLQVRPDAQVGLLLHRQRNLRDNMPVSPAQHLDASQASTEAEPPTFQDKSLSFPQHGLPRQENLTTFQEQSHVQRVILGARQGTQEFVYKQSELEKGISSEQPCTSSSSQAAEFEGLQEFMSIKSNSTGPLSHSKIPRLQESFLRFSQDTLPLQGHLKEHQECLATEKEAYHFSQKTQDNTSSEQTGLSSFIPQSGQLSFISLPSAYSGTTQEQTGLSSFIPQSGQLSFTSLPSAYSGTTQEPVSIDNNNKITASYFQIPELQDRLSKIAQCIQPQQENLKALQERVAAQREAIIQSRQVAQEEILLHKQRRWKGRLSPEQVGTSSSQHSFASLPLSESERTQELCPTNNNTTSSSHSEMLILPDRLLGLSHTVLPQQDNLIVLQEHLHAQTNSFPSVKKSQKELVLPRQFKFEEKVSSEHFVQSHHGDLKTLQQHLDVQRKAIRSGQELQEELLLQRLSKLEKRVSSEQVSSSSFSSQVALPVADSEGTQTSFQTKSSDTKIPRQSDRLLSPSQPILSQQGNLTVLLDLEREVCPNEKPQAELLLKKQNKSAEYAVPSLLLSKETDHSFIPLPFAEAKSKSICELYSENEHAAPSSDSVTPGFQDRLLSYSQPFSAQQDNVGLQKQLDLQRVLHYSQKAQEESLVLRQTALQQQIQKHQETLKDFFNNGQASQPTVENGLRMQKMEQLRECLPNIQDLPRDDQESNGYADRNTSDDNHLLSEAASASQRSEHLDKEPSRNASKPPVAKVKCGLDLNQHELSAIQEVESPASGRPSTPGKPNFLQDRDPMRVSISREQSFLGSPLAHDPFGCQQLPVQKGIKSDDSDEAVKVQKPDVENHAVLSYALEEEEYTCLSPTVKPCDKTETQEISHEPSSSITVSTGSFLSYENTELSLTDPESFSEHIDHQEQESIASKQKETDILNSIVPSTQAIYQQNSSDVHKSLLPIVEEFTSGHIHFRQMTEKHIKEVNVIPEKSDFRVNLDFPELEHIFPNLHRQLFKPLEAHPDFDLSSSSSVISQDNRDFYQSSDSSTERCTSSSRTVSFTALRRTSLHSFPNTRQPDPHAAAQSFAIENIEGSEQSFQQLLPEFSSQEGSQHADLPSIFSIETRDSSESRDNHKCPSEQTETLQNKKKSVHFQSSMCSSSDDTAVFDQLRVQHSTPCGSSSSESSIKLESREEKLGFEELSKREIDTVLQSQGLTEDKNTTCRVLAVNPHGEETDSQLWARTVEMGTSIQTPFSSEKYFENSTKETPKALRNLSQLAQLEPLTSRESFSFQSSIPIWETESGHGIMEEPELTLVSTSDISIAEADFANLTLEEKRENETKNFVQVGEFLPLLSETPDGPAVSENKPTAISGNLQEPFVKREKSFMEKACQRQKEIQSKTINFQPCTGSSVSHLRGINKVRALLLEERKTQVLRHQRALRLYDQLAEVKQQKEEKVKQAYAQNRARAKEFHKGSRVSPSFLCLK
ncbi:centrosomal protein of 295 kDa-like isoform X4 [Castor canadensis]|uniref:Centrosomal protein of 295 kDa-like isoform X4 n=1 Tax=Castor canadensis TaxID=51338 RepID=A0AC58N6F3_CASCN